jgi:hypothetical protein
MGLSAFHGFPNYCGPTESTHVSLPGLGPQLQSKFPPLAHGNEGGGFHPLRDHFSLLLSDGCIDMEGEVIDIAAEGGHHEVHLVFHESSDEMDVSG